MDLSALGRHNRLRRRRPGQRKVRSGEWSRGASQPRPSKFGARALGHTGFGKRGSADAAPGLRCAGRQPPGQQARGRVGDARGTPKGEWQRPRAEVRAGATLPSDRRRRSPGPVPGQRCRVRRLRPLPQPGASGLSTPKRPGVNRESSQADAERLDAAETTRGTVAARSQT